MVYVELVSCMWTSSSFLSCPVFYLLYSHAVLIILLLNINLHRHRGCTCLDGWAGNHCELKVKQPQFIKKSSANSNQDVNLIFAMIVMVVVVSVIVLLGIIISKRLASGDTGVDSMDAKDGFDSETSTTRQQEISDAPNSGGGPHPTVSPDTEVFLTSQLEMTDIDIDAKREFSDLNRNERGVIA